MSYPMRAAEAHPLQTQASPHYLKRILIALAMVAILLGVTQWFTPSTARAYTCGNIVFGHCYGRQDWPGGPINGADFYVSVVHMNPGDGFVNNEMWLADCDYYSIFPCFAIHFVETGYEVLPDGTEHYFWGDQRPGDSNVNDHVLGVVPTCDYSSTTYFEIHQYTSNSFEVVQSSCSGAMDNYSTKNTMTPSDILLGQELAGSTSAYAPRAYFTYNRWIDTSNVPHYQTSLGSLHYDNPPYVGWITDPQHSSTGGKLWTNCC